MLRQSVYGRLAGYQDVNDAERLRIDLAMRRFVGGGAKEKEAASANRDATVREGDDPEEPEVLDGLVGEVD